MTFNVENFATAIKNKKFSNQDLVNKLEEKGIDITLDTIKSYRRKNGKNAEPSTEKLLALSEILEVSTDYLLGNENELKVKYIPLIGVASCGIPNIAFNDEMDYIPVEASLARDGVYAIKALGDSMTPKIQENDIIVCDKEMDVYNGNIVHYTTIDGESGIKKYFYDKEKRQVTLTPLNQDYPPLVISEPDVKVARAFKIIGDL